MCFYQGKQGLHILVVMSNTSKSKAIKQQSKLQGITRHAFVIMAGITPRLRRFAEKHRELLFKQHLAS
jgi:hypothetical protein